MILRRLAIPSVSALLTVAVVTAAAQGLDCQAALTEFWTTASNVCVTGPDGYICNGGSAPSAEPAGAVSNALGAIGALVEVDEVTAIHTPRLDMETNSGGIAWLRLPAPLQASLLMVGDVSLRNVTPPDFPAWTSIVVETSPEPPTCPSAPNNVLVLQSALGQATRVVINGASLGLDGTVLVRTREAETIFVSLSGQSGVIVFGQEQPLLVGQQLSVPYNAGDFTRPVDAASSPVPFDPTMLQNLPVALFPRPVILPQPGFVRTDGAVNMRSSPSTDAGVIVQIPAGQLMSVLGADPTGDWYHVRLDTGETGWMLAELLQGNVGPIQSVYEATPLPPQRYGELGTGGRVVAPAGINLREGPDATFPVVASLSDGTMVTLVARSPYNDWVKVETTGAIGWIALLTLETQAFIDAVPIDYSAPPPPPPTLVPGTFGNAFPDPNGPDGQ